MSKVKEFLDSQDVDYKTVPGGELILEVCPVCGKENKFYVNAETGLHDCKICGHKGNLFKLKSLYGVIEGVSSARDLIGSSFKPMDIAVLESLETALWEDTQALNYLRGRGLTDATIKHFRIGYEQTLGGHWIAIPHIQDGKLWNVKYREFVGKKAFRRVQGQPTVLYNIDGVDYSKGGLVAAEGEFDVMAAWQMGVTNTVGLTGGAKTFKPEWLSVFAQFNKVYTCLDSDQTGQEGAKKVAEIIGLKKTRNVELPTNDINDYLNDATTSPADFKNLLGQAKQFEIDYIGTSADIVGQLDDWFSGEDTALRGLETGLPQFDALTKGLKDQDLIILSGDSGVGKTTLCLNIIHEIMDRGNAAFGFFLEGQIPYYFTRMIGAPLGLEYNELNNDPEVYEDIKSAAAELPLYYYSGSQGGLTLDIIKDIIPMVVRLYDIKVIFIDNLQKLVRGSDTMYYQRLGDTVSALKDLSVDNNIPIVLISHITKIDETKKVITMHDVKGSSTIYQDADIFAIFQAIKDEFYLSIDKNRMGEGGIHIPMNADKRLGLFKELDGEAVKTEDMGSQVPRSRAAD